MLKVWTKWFDSTRIESGCIELSTKLKMMSKKGEALEKAGEAVGRTL